MTIYEIPFTEVCGDIVSINLRGALRELKNESDNDGYILINVIGLKCDDLNRSIIGLRLALPFIGAKALWPIVILSSEENPYFKCGFSADIVERELYDEILLTPGIYMCNDPNTINISRLKQLDIKDYKKGFLDRIKIQGNVGSHSIGNEWAAYNIGRMLSGGISELPESKDLVYLCYLLVSGMSEDQLKTCVEGKAGASIESNVEKIKEYAGKKILLIDDQDDVWGPVMKKFVPNLSVWGKQTEQKNKYKCDKELPLNDRDEFDKEDIESIIKGYDLVLLDMRLKGSAEQDKRAESLSGIKVLKELMTQNEGLPVIMFTSSNKSWNIKSALGNGASDVYVKESPQFAYNEAERLEDFNHLIDSVNYGLRYSWLKEVVSMSKEITDRLDDSNYIEEKFNRANKVKNSNEIKSISYVNFSSNDVKELFKEVLTQIEVSTQIFVSAIKQRGNNFSEKMRLAYLSLEKVIELFASKHIDGNSKRASERFIEIINLLYGECNGRPSIMALVDIRNYLVHGVIRGNKDTILIMNDKKINGINESCKPKDVYEKKEDSLAFAFRALMYRLHKIM